MFTPTLAAFLITLIFGTGFGLLLIYFDRKKK
jgi:hypothetical protein